MARSAKFPPPIYSKAGYSFCRVKGVHRHLGKTGSDQAKAAYAALCAELSSQPAQPPAPTLAAPTVQGVVAAFLIHAEAHYSARGRELEAFPRAVTPLLKLFRDLPAEDFGPKALKAVQKEMADMGWCRNVVNRQARRIRTIWNWAESEEMLPKGSTAALKTVRGLRRNDPVRNSPRRQPTEWADLQAVLPHCAPVISIMLQVQWWSGCRSQDVRLMRFEDIDQDGPTVDGVTVWLYTPSLDKGDWREGAEESPRVVVLGPECQRLLTNWVDFTGTTSGHIFRSRYGRYFKRGSYGQAVARACAAAGVKIQAYGSRHSARMRVGREMSDEAARAFLGQKHINTTQLYGRRDIQHAAEVAARMG